MRWRRRSLALVTLALQGAALTLLPALHEAVHRRGHGSDHVHFGAETRWLFLGGGAEAGPAAGPDGSPEALHEAFDADLAALDLVEAAHFGVTPVDCSLARYTLASCGSDEAPPHSFGDELASRLPHRHPDPGPPLDPLHGLHSLEHFGLALLSTPAFLLPPPVQPLDTIDLPRCAQPSGASPLLALRARSPPRAA